MATELSKIRDLNTDDTICSIYGRYPGALTCALPSPSPKIHGHVVCELLHFRGGSIHERISNRQPFHFGIIFWQTLTKYLHSFAFQQL
jgi:hypothetical protein